MLDPAGSGLEREASLRPGQERIEGLLAGSAAYPRLPDVAVDEVDLSGLAA